MVIRNQQSPSVLFQGDNVQSFVAWIRSSEVYGQAYNVGWILPTVLYLSSGSSDSARRFISWIPVVVKKSVILPDTFRIWLNFRAISQCVYIYIYIYVYCYYNIINFALGLCSSLLEIPSHTFRNTISVLVVTVLSRCLFCFFVAASPHYSCWPHAQKKCVHNYSFIPLLSTNYHYSLFVNHHHYNYYQ